jgi:hypothetical protein
MRKAASIGSIAVLSWMLWSLPASMASAQSPSEAFAAGTHAFGEERFESALAHFETALALGVEGPAIHYNIGVCRYKLGRYAAAAEAFALIADEYPEMRGLALYNLGLVASKQNEAATATDYFRDALASTDDETIRYLALQQLGGGEDAPSRTPAARRSWFALLDVQLGYDDNVLLLSDEIPLPDGQSAESSFVELWGLVSTPLGSSDTAGFRFDGNFYMLRYPEASMFDQTVIYAGAPYAWAKEAWYGEVGPHVSMTTIDADVLDQRLGLGAMVSRQIVPGTSVGLRYVHEEVEKGDAIYAFFAGARDFIELRVDRRGERGRLTLAYGHERNDREAATVSPRRDRLSLRYRYALNSHWRLDAQGTWRESLYDELAVPRDEALVELGVGASRDLADGWQLTGALSIADNDSNLETVVYRRKRVSLGVTKQF